MNNYKNMINTTRLEVQNLNSKNEYYELELLDARNNIIKYIDKYALYISYLELQILSILNNSNVNYGDISVEQTKYIVSLKPYLIILDDRTQEQYKNSHVEGSINISLNVGFNILFIYLMGLKGIAFSTSLVCLISFLFLWFFVTRLIAQKQRD